MEQEFYNWLPEELRQSALQAIKGQKVVEFPVAYFPKCPKSQHLAWQNLAPAKNGLAIKTAPDFLIANLIKTLDKYQVEYEVIQL